MSAYIQTPKPMSWLATRPLKKGATFIDGGPHILSLDFSIFRLLDQIIL